MDEMEPFDIQITLINASALQPATGLHTQQRAIYEMLHLNSARTRTSGSLTRKGSLMSRLYLLGVIGATPTRPRFSFARFIYTHERADRGREGLFHARTLTIS